MMDYNKHEVCLLCGSDQLQKMKNYQHAYLVKCRNCSFVFSERIPTMQELIDHYTSTYSRADYLSPLTVKRYHELLDKFEPYRKSNRLIDVGCGIGYFLQVAKERGWQVYGTEYTDDAVKICRDKGFNIHQGKLDPSVYEPGFFDIVTSFEVLEHINNPNEELANFNTILRQGGLVYFTTPNFNSLSRLSTQELWTVIQYPEHLCYYTRATLGNLFRRHGFRRKKFQTTGFSVTRFQIASTNVKQKYIDEGSADERLRNQMESGAMSFAKKVFNGIFTLTGTGDTLKGWFEKK